MHVLVSPTWLKLWCWHGAQPNPATAASLQRRYVAGQRQKTKTRQEEITEEVILDGSDGSGVAKVVDVCGNERLRVTMWGHMRT
jgi:hypothetical protein